jgi:hypothetical protein
MARFDHAMLFNFLDEHLSSCSAKDRARLDLIIFEKLSDYAAIHELLVYLVDEEKDIYIGVLVLVCHLVSRAQPS